MGQIRVTASQLNSIAGELEAMNSNFKSNVMNLQNVEGTLRTQWEGEAQKTFDAAFVRDAEKMELFAKTVDQYIQSLRTIAGKYAQTESTNASLVK